MCEFCESDKGLLKHQRYPAYKGIDASEAFISRNDNNVFIDLRMATGDIINDQPVRNCYEINIYFCPICGKKLKENNDYQNFKRDSEILNDAELYKLYGDYPY